MALDPYTHTFKFEINDTFIRGECEFNTDGEASFKLDTPESASQPLPLETIKHFTELMELIKHIHDEGKAKDKEVKISNITIQRKAL